MILAVATYFTFGSVVSVGVGKAVIIVDPVNQYISEPISGATWYMFGKPPWAKTESFYVGVDKLGMWGDGTDEYADMPAIASVSKDGLKIRVDIMIRWQIDVSRLRDLYLRYPQKNWKFDVIGSVVRQSIRNAVSEYSTIEIIENRTIVAQRILEVATTSIEEQLPSLMNAIINLEVELRDIIPPEQFLNASQAKLAKEQEMLQAEFEAETIIILAQADADAVLIAAQAESDAKVIIANGTRDAIKQIVTVTGMTNATQITQLYLTLETLKTVPDLVVFLNIGDDGVPVIYTAPK